MPEGLVSVVIAARDEEAYIGEALASVRAQTYRSVEIIVVDDGSADRTGEIAAAAGARVLSQPHRGVAAARNAGLAVARGEYWTSFDADDLMPAERLARQLDYLRRHPDYDIVLGLTEAFSAPGRPRPPHWNPVWDRGAFPGHPGTTLGHARVLDLVGGYDESLLLGEDLDWQLRAQEAGIRAGRLGELCLRYRIHPGNASCNPWANRTATLSALRESLHRRRAEVADAR
jgi:glycosyltransferase involved in cell wall biosynthesis